MRGGARFAGADLGQSRELLRGLGQEDRPIHNLLVQCVSEDLADEPTEDGEYSEPDQRVGERERLAPVHQCRGTGHLHEDPRSGGGPDAEREVRPNEPDIPRSEVAEPEDDPTGDHDDEREIGEECHLDEFPRRVDNRGECIGNRRQSQMEQRHCHHPGDYDGTDRGPGPFCCRSCGYENHADYDAAKNIGLKLLRTQTGAEGGAPVGVRLNSGMLNTNGVVPVPDSVRVGSVLNATACRPW